MKTRNIGLALKGFRLGLKKGPEEIATALRALLQNDPTIDEHYINRVENGVTGPSKKRLALFCQVLGCTMEELQNRAKGIGC